MAHIKTIAKLLAVAAIMALPGPALSDVASPSGNPQVASADCVSHKIIGANAGVKKIDFLNKDGSVIESRAEHLQKDEMSIPVLGCDANYLFVMSPKGNKAKVKRIDVILDGQCTAALVSDATAANHSTTGLGAC